MVRRARLDAELVRRGLVPSRERAAEAIAAGRVSVEGRASVKAATGVAPGESLLVREGAEEAGYVSRGGHKLAGALSEFSLDASGLRCLDAGASTGGFTDVLLRAGACTVHAVDVGYGQLAWSLRTDPRVHVHERVNVRYLDPQLLDGQVDLTVADLSFISLTLVLPALVGATRPGGHLVVLVKPQFEVGRGQVGPGGVVRDEARRRDAVLAVARAAVRIGVATRAAVPSALPGPAGNVEYFLWLTVPEPRRPLDSRDEADLLAGAFGTPADPEGAG